MAEYISLDILIPYEIMCLFLFYQSMHHSRALMEKSAEIVLGISIILGVLSNFIFLVVFGIQTIWWAPFLLVILFVPSLILGVILEKIVSRTTIALLGFIVWPICAYFLFTPYF